eukprot:TRINITY_DN21420_c0_g1_i1.p1 TRINITY_DN21420_c0_g1~~TRINITY_DN21420_c0_g1_i1.p1  ORF type:complete len:146 (+),score=37.17 TRINITY_DN21420_c0_g1_i1:38-475(+)
MMSDEGICHNEDDEQSSEEVLPTEDNGKKIAALKKKIARSGEDEKAALQKELAFLKKDRLTTRPAAKKSTNYKQEHDKRMDMKLKQKHVRDGNGCAAARFKKGAAISEKQWARMDDKHRELAVKNGALPPYKVAKRNKKQHQPKQ